MDAETQRELTHLIKQLRKVSDTAKRQSQKAFKEAAGPLVSAIQGRAPESDKTHYRYAGGGEGILVAQYEPGNLKRSFRTLTFRKSAAVFVGAKLAKGDAKGIFKGRRADGYYAHWVEFGTEERPARPFVRPAVDAAGDLVLRIASDILKREIESLNK